MDPRERELVGAKERWAEDLLGRPGVNAVDVGPKYVRGVRTDELAIRVFVDEKRDVAKPEAIPNELDGLPTDVI